MPADPGSGFTLITLLLDNAIPWNLVAQNDDSANQLFAWFPLIIANALGIDRKSPLSFSDALYANVVSRNPDNDVGVAGVQAGSLHWPSGRCHAPNGVSRVH